MAEHGPSDPGQPAAPAAGSWHHSSLGPEPGMAGRTRLGNPPNADHARPPGACRILMIGDVIGKPGRQALERLVPELRESRGLDFVTANGENVAGGMGLTPSLAQA